MTSRLNKPFLLQIVFGDGLYRSCRNSKAAVSFSQSSTRIRSYPWSGCLEDPSSCVFGLFPATTILTLSHVDCKLPRVKPAPIRTVPEGSPTFLPLPFSHSPLELAGP